MSPAEQHLLDAVLAAIEAPGAEDARRRFAEILGPHLAPCTVAEPDPWIDSKAAATHLGISHDQLRKLTASRARGLVFSQEASGSKTWFRRSDLDAYRGQHLQGHRDA